MNKLQNITEKVRATNDPCKAKDCNEGHKCLGYHEDTDEYEWGMCEVCNGKGYVQELDYTIEQLALQTLQDYLLKKSEQPNIDKSVFQDCLDIYRRTFQGKPYLKNEQPLDGMELLLALRNKSKLMNQENITIKFDGFNLQIIFQSGSIYYIPLDKKLSEYDDVLLDQLDKIL
jgi:hypothetical protein